jgi:protein transport protein SEC20
METLLKDSLKIRQNIIKLRDTPVLTKKEINDLYTAIFYQLDEFSNNIKLLTQEQGAAINIQTIEAQKSELQNLHALYRAAKMECEKNRKNQDLLERELLLNGKINKTDISSRNEKTLVEESKQINSTLSQLRASMVDIKSQSQAINSKLGDSSQVLKQVAGEHDKIGANLNQSKHLMSSYNIRDMTDKLLLFIAVIFYFSVCLFIIFSRVHAPLSTIWNFFVWILNLFYNYNNPSAFNLKCVGDLCKA